MDILDDYCTRWKLSPPCIDIAKIGEEFQCKVSSVSVCTKQVYSCTSLSRYSILVDGMEAELSHNLLAD